MESRLQPVPHLKARLHLRLLWSLVLHQGRMESRLQPVPRLILKEASLRLDSIPGF